MRIRHAGYPPGAARQTPERGTHPRRPRRLPRRADRGGPARGLRAAVRADGRHRGGAHAVDAATLDLDAARRTRSSPRPAATRASSPSCPPPSSRSPCRRRRPCPRPRPASRAPAPTSPPSRRRGCAARRRRRAPVLGARGARQPGAALRRALEAEFGAVVRRQLCSGCTSTSPSVGADRALAVYNALRSYLPDLAALAANAPFYAGRDTGLASVRPKIARHAAAPGRPARDPELGGARRRPAWGARRRAIAGAAPVVVRAAPAPGLRHARGARARRAGDRRGRRGAGGGRARARRAARRAPRRRRGPARRRRRGGSPRTAGRRAATASSGSSPTSHRRRACRRASASSALLDELEPVAGGSAARPSCRARARSSRATARSASARSPPSAARAGLVEWLAERFLAR